MTPALKLENQLCFPLYTASRLVVQAYTPLLKSLNLTYPQYLVLLILWEKDGISVGQITARLHLDTNTVTPLLKRMESDGWLFRERSKSDERKVEVRLTEKGREAEKKAVEIPNQLVQGLTCSSETLQELKTLLDKLIQNA